MDLQLITHTAKLAGNFAVGRFFKGDIKMAQTGFEPRQCRSWHSLSLDHAAPN